MGGFLRLIKRTHVLGEGVTLRACPSRSEASAFHVCLLPWSEPFQEGRALGLEGHLHTIYLEQTIIFFFLAILGIEPGLLYQELHP